MIIGIIYMYTALNNKKYIGQTEEVALKYNINYSVLCRKLKRKDIKLNNKILSLNSYEVK